MTASSAIATGATPRLKEFADRSAGSFAVMLLASGFFGLVIGIVTASWQDAIEPGQFLSGLVSYAPGTLQFAYNASIFSLLNYLSAAFLQITNSEIAASIILCAVVGIMAMQAMAMLLFYITRNAHLAVLGGILVHAFSLIGWGVAYPVLFFGSPHVFGRAGHLFALYAILFFAFRKYRTAFFLAGLALAVHPSWGLFLNTCLWVVLGIHYRVLKPLATRANAIAYALGAGISIGLLLWQKLHFPIPAGIGADQVSELQLFVNYISYWDLHRQKVGDIRILARGFLFAAVPLAWALYSLRRKTLANGEILFFQLLAVSAPLAALLLFVPSWFEPDVFPQFFINLIPARFINLSIIIAYPILLGLVLSKPRTLASLVATVAGWWITFRLLSHTNVMGLMVQGVPLLIALGIAVAFNQRSRDSGTAQRKAGLNLGLAVVVALLVAASPLYLLRENPLRDNRFVRIPFERSFPGGVLTTAERYLFQAEERVPVIHGIIDGYQYAGEGSLQLLNEFMKDMYSLSLEKPPRAGLHLHGGSISTADYQALWEQRSCATWRQLGDKYRFEWVLVPDKIHLLLPPADVKPGWTMYRASCEIS